MYTYSTEAGPLLAAENGPPDHKFGPASTTVGKGENILANKSCLEGTFLAAKITPGGHIWAGPIFT